MHFLDWLFRTHTWIMNVFFFLRARLSFVHNGLIASYLIIINIHTEIAFLNNVLLSLLFFVCRLSLVWKIKVSLFHQTSSIYILMMIQIQMEISTNYCLIVALIVMKLIDWWYLGSCIGNNLKLHSKCI